MTPRAHEQPSLFDEPPAAPPVRHAAEQETPVAAEALRMADGAVDGDVCVSAPVFDWLTDYVSGR